MSGLDWAIVAVLAICVLNAARRGFLVEALSLAGLVVGLPLAAWNYHSAAPYFAPWLRNEALAEAAGFLAIAVGVMLAAGLLGRVIRWGARSVGLGWADRLMGAGFGLLKGAALVTIAMVAVAAWEPALPVLGGEVRSSKLAPYFLQAARSGSVVAPGHLAERVRRGLRQLHDEGWAERHEDQASRW
jgi:membrane protein required for colicin V production